jgi:hypothetical protein
MMAAQSFKSMAGAITVAEVITMDGVEAIIMDGAIVTGAIIMAITVGETSLPSCGDYSGKKPPLGGFFFGRIVASLPALFWRAPTASRNGRLWHEPDHQRYPQFGR